MNWNFAWNVFQTYGLPVVFIGLTVIIIWILSEKSKRGRRIEGA